MVVPKDGIMDNNKSMEVPKDTSSQPLGSSKKGFVPRKVNLKSSKLNKIDDKAFLEDGNTKFQMVNESQNISNNETGNATKNQITDELKNTSSKPLAVQEKDNTESPSSLNSTSEAEDDKSQTDLNSKQSNEIDNIDNLKNKIIKIHLVDGEKGGCGKSFFTKSFIKYCDSIGHDLIIIDADKSNEDIFNLYKEHKTKKIRKTFFSDDDNKQKEADSIFTAALEKEKKSVLVNLPAQVAEKLNSWLDSGDLINLAKENNIQFIKWFVCNGSVESFNFFLNSLKSTDMQHILVENLGLCDEDGWKFIKDKPEFKEAETKYNFISIPLHKFPFYERNCIDQNQIPFTDILNSDVLDTVSKSRVRRMFFEKMDSAFKEIKIINE